MTLPKPPDATQYKFMVRYFFAPDDHFDILLSGDDIESAVEDKDRQDTERAAKGSENSTLMVSGPANAPLTLYYMAQVRYWRIIPNPKYLTPEQREAEEKKEMQRKLNTEFPNRMASAKSRR